MEELLPLPDHTQVTVIHDGDFELDTFLLQSCEFLHIHLEAAIAGNNPDGCIGKSHFHAHGRWQGKSHRTQSARGDMAVGTCPLVEASSPHLMLPHIRDHDGIAVGSGTNSL